MDGPDIQIVRPLAGGGGNASVDLVRADARIGEGRRQTAAGREGRNGRRLVSMGLTMNENRAR